MQTDLFNESDLTGWRGDLTHWSVIDGSIRGRNDGPLAASTYLLTEGAYREFRLTFTVRQSVGAEFSTMHSAVGALGEQITDAGDPYGYRGPLLMFCSDWGIWEAHGRERLCPAGHRGTVQHPAERVGESNRIEILVLGDRIRFVANGELVFDFTDEPGQLRAGPIGLQLHANDQPQEFWFSDLALDPEPEDRLLTLA